MAWTLTQIYQFGRNSGGGPLTAMFTVDCVPPFVTKLIEWISTHGPITALLTQGSRTLEEIRTVAKSMA